MPGGSLISKPTCRDAYGQERHVGFFCFLLRRDKGGSTNGLRL